MTLKVARRIEARLTSRLAEQICGDFDAGLPPHEIQQHPDAPGGG
jgi:hypothetical protein